MTALTYITPTFAVAPALKPDDFAKLRDAGIKTIVSNLPDGEDQAHLTGGQAAELALRNGLAFRHIPAGKLDLFNDAVVDSTEDVLRDLDAPVVAFCQSGLRSAIIWGATLARNQPVSVVLEALTNAGFDLEFLREDLDAQASINLQHCSSAAAIAAEAERRAA